MSKGERWDLTSLHSLEGAAEWIRKNAGAQLVLVVRPGDVAFAVDPQISPRDAKGLVEAELDRSSDVGCVGAAKGWLVGLPRRHVYGTDGIPAAGLGFEICRGCVEEGV